MIVNQPSNRTEIWNGQFLIQMYMITTQFDIKKYKSTWCRWHSLWLLSYEPLFTLVILYHSWFLSDLFSFQISMLQPDSLGPLDLEMHSCRYQSNDLILSDSLSGLNRLIANSLDAFQSCSFFCSDKKEPPPPHVAETRQTASIPDFKIERELR